ncbi:MATE family efflux transporter [Catenisphaera adipataccumulans]|jgi:putative MATE family efflux protein|uniref:Putative MATE family efflux protein n=1 Tax=Catenisphaera adipataccumulans TaxID=700500 RepID=A0A7W8CWY6_9FIRM|nr:MATE family efflux transporter [Catenisphaera adipataccumulans]MBB5183126.1 putative MATE family efflux protein [Catenisphaera adipataccumulans]
MKKFASEIDMLHGPLAGKLVQFAIPLALTNILQQLFNSADLAVIGQFENAAAMAAVGSNASVINLLVSLFSGLALGANVVIAMLIGQDRTEKINEAVHTAITVALVSGWIVCGLGEVLAPYILRWMQTPPEVRQLAVLYLRIFFVGIPFLLTYDCGASVLRAKGDSARPLFVLLISGTINVVLNIFFVAVCHLSVAGVAIATVTANLVSAVIVLYFLMHEQEAFRFSFRKLGIRGNYLRRIIAIGAPAGLQGMVFSLSNVVIQSGINSFGSACIAGNTAAQNFEFMCYFLIFGFAQAATTFTSQNFAAGNMDRCRKIYRLSLLLGCGFTFLLSLFFYCGKETLIRFFTNDPAVISYAYIRLAYISNFELLTGTYEIPGGCMRGMGRSLTPALITMICCCALRLVWIATYFQAHHSIETLLLIYVLSWIVAGVIMHLAYFHFRRSEFYHLSV